MMSKFSFLPYLLASFMLVLFGYLPAFGNIGAQGKKGTVFIRVNQLGFLAEDQKVGLAFSQAAVKGNFIVYDADSHQPVYKAKLLRSREKGCEIVSCWSAKNDRQENFRCFFDSIQGSIINDTV
jgi:hypothetical protein